MKTSRRLLFTYDEKTLTYQPVRRRSISNVMTLSILSLIILGFSGFTKSPQIEHVYTEPELIVLNQKFDQFSVDKLKNELDRLNIMHQDIVLAQATLETANFTSAIFKENNNLFGMKEAKLRSTTNIGTERNHAAYTHWKESVVDYALYQMKYLSRLNRDQYFEYLRQNYAEDPNYVDKLKKLIEKMNG